jgi:histidine triad (HIT) family protein
VSECIFCQIVAGQAPAQIIHRDEQVTAFHDRRPIAATHILIVPNRHIASLNELQEADAELISHLVLAAKKLAEQAGVAETGYRLMLNTGEDGGQTVPHLHLHLIAGKWARWKLG